VVEGIERVARGERVPLSFAQQRLWFLDQLQPGNSAYIIPGALRLRGTLLVRHLARSFERLVERHESLRTILPVVDGVPVQHIQAAGRWPLPVVDLSGLAVARREAEGQRVLQAELARPFVLDRGPLLRSRVLRLTDREHILLLSMHHSIADGWSMQICLRELTTFYQAACTGEAVPLGPLPIQYADYALWQRGWLTGAVLEEQVRYWRQQLAGASELLLPTDFARPHVQSYRGAGYRFSLPADLSAQVLTLARQERVTTFMLLLAAFQALLYRWTAQTDIVVGTDVANRNQRETEQLIGFFINLLALRGDLRGSPDFRHLLQRTREMVLAAYTHREVPFDLLVEQLRLPRQMNRTPLIRLLFVLENLPGARQRPLPGLSVETLEGEATSAKFDLALFMHEAPGGLQGAVVYQADLFGQETIATLMDRFELLLRQVVAQPERSIDVLDIATPQERGQQAQASKRLSASDLRSLRLSKGEEVNLENMHIQQTKPTRG
jgi:hypothetical protein